MDILCTIIAIASILMLFISLPFFPNLLVNGLENKYNPIIDFSRFNTDKNVYILVLGGGHKFSIKFPSNVQLSSRALGRLVEGIRLYNIFPKSKLIFSGWSEDGILSHAEILMNTALSMGIDSNRILLLKNPRNTYEESIYCSKLINENETLFLITDAIHSYRAMLLFENQLFKPIPSPVNFLGIKRNKIRIKHYLPSYLNIKKFEYAIHEYLGLLWLKIKYLHNKYLIS